jgi:hypothetical protein
MAYTTIDDPSAYFQTLLYTGNATGRSLDNTGNSDLKPDWIWVKKRANDAQNHTATDSTRGVANILFQDGTDAESATQLVTEFRTNGFGINTNALINDNTDTYVAWQWKANGGTTSSDSNGGITSTVQASTTAGFSITKFDSTSASGQATVGHGLGAIPHVIIMKDLVQTYGWDVHHIKAGSSDADGRLVLNSNEAWNNASNVQAFGVAGSTSSGIAPTSTTFSFNQAFYSSSGDAKIVYCFTPIQGYSKFGSYTGSGNTDGPFIYTGFAPSWILVKRIDGGTENWFILDNKRDDGLNPRNSYIMTNQNTAEDANNSTVDTDFVSNGFKLRASTGALNTNGATYVYMAFAESPFVTSTGIPTTAR